MFPKINDHIKLLTIFAIFMIIVQVAGNLFLTGQANKLLSQSEDAWASYKEHAFSRSKLLHQIEQGLGYGGFIHNFKNYLIRKEDWYKAHFEQGSNHLKHLIHEYLNNPKYQSTISTEERKAFETILEKTEEYEQKINIITLGQKKNLPVAEIDNMVKINDAPTIKALWQLNYIVEKEENETLTLLDQLNKENIEVQKIKLLFLPLSLLIGLILIGLFIRLSEETSRSQSAEKNAKSYQRRLDSILTKMKDVFIMSDSDGNILDINIAFTNLFGYEKKDLLDKKMSFLIPSFADIPINSTIPNEIKTKTKDGKDLILELLTTKISIEDNIFFVSVMRNVSERKNLEKSFQEKDRMESLAGMAGGMTHEINNALQPVLGLSEAMISRLDPSDERNITYMEKIRDNAFHIRNIVTSVLAFSRKSNDELNEYVLNDFLETIITYSDEFLPLGVEIQTEGINEQTRPYCINTSKSSFLQILTNLFTNASYAMDKKGTIFVNLKISVLGSDEATKNNIPAGTYAMISITDTGHGMDEETRKHIFEPFFTTKPEDKGTGLGLPVVYGILKELKGSIEVHSEPKKGTTFTIYHPIFKKQS